MRKKKTPEELAAEAEMEDEDEFTSKFIILIFHRIKFSMIKLYFVFYFLQFIYCFKIDFFFLLKNIKTDYATLKLA